MKVAVMGCVVNGPGESKHADIGISLPGTGEAPVAVVHVDGSKFTTLRGENIAMDFQNIVDEYIHNRYSRPTRSEKPAELNHHFSRHRAVLHGRARRAIQ